MNKRAESFGFIPSSADGATPKAAVGWEGVPDESGPLHVITLLASVAPIPLRAPSAPELAGLAIFRSRTVEDGRERFRLHVGYFPTAAAAEQVLPIVRQSYPAAIVNLAPQGSMGSLDDTALARFSILRQADKSAAEPVSPAAPPRAAPMGPPAQPSARAAATPLARIPAPSAPVTRSMLDDSPSLTSAPLPTPPVLRRADAVVAPPPIPPLAEPASRESQHYAVQLIWSREAIDLAKIPLLAIFSGYLLYAVETEPSARRYFGVRLGFYNDALSARLVAQYVRSDFKNVAVVPVSQRELTRASTAAIRLGASRRASSSSESRTRWPAAALAVDAANLGRAFSPGVV